MTTDSKPDAAAFVAEVERCYAALIDAAGDSARAGEEPSLGGKLLYAGELDAMGRAVVVAGNVAGAATLAATSDADAQKQAVRDGVVDFLVTTLDEALRISKNEIRKRETVAVCVGAAPEDVEREMMERGVLPDLVFAGWAGKPRNPGSFGTGAKEVEVDVAEEHRAFVTWEVTEAPARWMPKLDAILIDSLGDRDLVLRRWLRLAPRYFGRSALGERVMTGDAETVKQLVARASDAVKRGEIGVKISIGMTLDGQSQVILAAPAAGRDE